MLSQLFELITRPLLRIDTEERGAVGALIIGIIIGVALVVFGVIKFLIPGE